MRAGALLVAFVACSPAHSLRDGASIRATPWGRWEACRTSSLPPGGSALLSDPRHVPSASSECMAAVVPGTVLGTLLANQTFRLPDGTPIVDPFLDASLAAIPDISASKDYYSFTFRTTIDSANVDGCQGGPIPKAARVVLSLLQQSYRTSLFVGGSAAPVAPVGAPPGETQAVGMFRGFDFLIPIAPASFCVVLLHGFSFEVLPPDHAGNASDTCKGCGQGGNHDIAQDLISQDTAGWDWVRGTPDRNTGLIDPASLYIAAAGVLMRGAAISVMRVEVSPSDPALAGVVAFVFRAALLNLDSAAAANGTLHFSVAGLNASVAVSLPSNPGGAWVEVESPLLLARGVALWWPHTLGTPALYDAVANFTRAEDATATTSIRWRAGFRLVSSEVDPELGGQVFSVNGARLYIQGGNWIASDQFSRSEFRGIDRYFAEVRLHVEMGLNVIRLWGGHGGHGEALWDAADELGVLLFLEFGMSGDNNGRWGGSYAYPLDHRGYLEAVADTMRRARGHASLLLYCAGNELWPLSLSPPPDILVGLEALHGQLDPTSVFEQSSMGSDQNGTVFSNFTLEVAAKVLSPSDGNYGPNDVREWFVRNPGRGNDTLKVAFQPECGNTASPDFESLARFLSPAVRESLPPANSNGNNADKVWTFHNYLPFTDGLGRDLLYAYLPPGVVVNASEYSRAAGMAQFAQYQALFEGYQEFLMVFYSAQIMWKSAGPWPAFRGALYDYYLATSGGFFGARAATEAGRALHVQFSRDWRRPSAGVSVLNKGLRDAAGPFTVSATAFQVAPFRELAQSPPYATVVPSLARNTVVQLPALLAWPAGAVAGQTLLWRAELRSASGLLVSRTEQLLSSIDNNMSIAANFSSLVAERYGGRPLLIVDAVAAAKGIADVLRVSVTITNPVGSGRAALALRCSLVNPLRAVRAATGYMDERVLPQYPSSAYFSLVPSESAVVTIEVAGQPEGESLFVNVDGWNVAAQRVTVAMVEHCHSCLHALE